MLEKVRKGEGEPGDEAIKVHGKKLITTRWGWGYIGGSYERKGGIMFGRIEYF